MTSSRYRDSRWSERLEAPIDWSSKVVPVAVVAAILVIVVAAVLIARGDSAEEIAGDAQVLTWSESVSSAIVALRAEVREGLVVGQSADFGVFGEDATAESAARIRDAVDELESRADVLADIADDDGMFEAAGVAGEHALAVAVALESGDTDGALAITEEQLSPAVEGLSERTTSISEESAAHIAAVNAGLGTVTTAARFVAALLIPALVIFLFYRALRRSQRVSLLKTELARERELRRKKDAFVAAASHHVRTPLSAVVGFAELLRGGSDFSAGVRDEVVELIATEAEETSNVVDDLLAAARYDVGDFELDEDRIEMRDVIDSITTDWERDQRAKLSIRGNAVVLGDERWLRHAIRNLLRTAASSGGEEIQVGIESTERRVVVDVSDNGAAIATEENVRITELYYPHGEADGLAPSLGLGLSVARRIAKASGGDLRYQRRDGLNVFEMTLPGVKSQVRPREAFNRIIDPTVGMPEPESIELAIASGGPQLDFQPIVAFSPGRPEDHRVVGYEALARFGSHSPTDWFLSASRLGLAVELEQTCIRAAVDRFHPLEEDSFLAVNISDETLHTSELEDVIAGIDPSRLVFELSETAPIASYERTRQVLDRLAMTGTRVAIDEVGSGDLDLMHLARLDAHIVKISASLVRQAGQSRRSSGLVKAIAAMAGELGAWVVAVGVETEEEHALLADLGVGYGQGHLYARPRRLDQERNRTT